MRPLLVLSGLNGVIALIALSLAAHGLGNDTLQEQKDWLGRGAEFQLWHALALLALCALEARKVGNNWTKLSAWSFQLGIVLFSGSLYWLSFAGSGGLAPFELVTPLGGLFLIGGWLCLMMAGISDHRA